MSDILEIEGKVWLFGDNISTDLLYPQVAFGQPIAEAAKLVFRANRPGWVDLVEPGDVIVAGMNFGMGSARPAAPLLKHLGISAVVGETLANLFFRNCINFALPAMSCPRIATIVTEGDTLRINFANGLVTNTSRGTTLHGQQLPSELLDVIADGGLIASLEARHLLQPERKAT